MNIENILKVAAAIERAPHAVVDDSCVADNVTSPIASFNMKVWRCNTVGCIGGWAVQLLLGGPFSDTDRVADLFDIRVEDAYDLCYPSGVNYQAVTPAEAAQVLRHLAATGLVDWSILEETV